MFGVLEYNTTDNFDLSRTYSIHNKAKLAEEIVKFLCRNSSTRDINIRVKTSLEEVANCTLLWVVFVGLRFFSLPSTDACCNFACSTSHYLNDITNKRRGKKLFDDSESVDCLFIFIRNTYKVLFIFKMAT